MVLSQAVMVLAVVSGARPLADHYLVRILIGCALSPGGRAHWLPIFPQESIHWLLLTPCMCVCAYKHEVILYLQPLLMHPCSSDFSPVIGGETSYNSALCRQIKRGNDWGLRSSASKHP